MKLIIIIIFIHIISSISISAEAELSSFESLEAIFHESQIANQSDLTGVYIGICYFSPRSITYYKEIYPQIGLDLNEIEKTATTILFGKSYADGFHVGNFEFPSIRRQIEKTPGEQVSKYVEFYRTHKEDLENELKKIPPASIVGNSLQNSFEVSHFNTKMEFSHEFRKLDNRKLISEIVGKDLRLPSLLQGVQAVCYWYNKID